LSPTKVKEELKVTKQVSINEPKKSVAPENNSSAGRVSPDKDPHNDSIEDEIPQQNDTTFLTSPNIKEATHSLGAELRSESPVIGFNKEE
jgi:hypothetical protein